MPVNKPVKEWTDADVRKVWVEGCDAWDKALVKILNDMEDSKKKPLEKLQNKPSSLIGRLIYWLNQPIGSKI